MNKNEEEYTLNLKNNKYIWKVIVVTLIMIILILTITYVGERIDKRDKEICENLGGEYDSRDGCFYCKKNICENYIIRIVNGKEVLAKRW